VFVIAAPTFAAAELDVDIFPSAPAPALPTCAADIPLLAGAGFPAPLPRPRSAHGLLTGGGAGTGPDACAGVVEVDLDDVVVEDAVGRCVDVDAVFAFVFAFDVFVADVEFEVEEEERMAERSREVGVEVEGAGERIWEEFGVRQLYEERGLVVRSWEKREKEEEEEEEEEEKEVGYRLGGGLEVMVVREYVCIGGVRVVL